MAALPNYHADQLASSQVGVPIMNQAGAITANSILQNTQALSNTALQSQRENIEGQSQALETDASQAASYAGQYAGHINEQVQIAQREHYYAMQDAQRRAAAAEAQAQQERDNANVQQNFYDYQKKVTDQANGIQDPTNGIPATLQGKAVEDMADNEGNALKKKMQDQGYSDSVIDKTISKAQEFRQGVVKSALDKQNTAEAHQIVDKSKDQAQNDIDGVHNIATFNSMAALRNSPDQIRSDHMALGPQGAQQQNDHVFHLAAVQAAHGEIADPKNSDPVGTAKVIADPDFSPLSKYLKETDLEALHKEAESIATATDIQTKKSLSDALDAHISTINDLKMPVDSMDIMDPNLATAAKSNASQGVQLYAQITKAGEAAIAKVPPGSHQQALLQDTLKKAQDKVISFVKEQNARAHSSQMAIQAEGRHEAAESRMEAHLAHATMMDNAKAVFNSQANSDLRNEIREAHDRLTVMPVRPTYLGTKQTVAQKATNIQQFREASDYEKYMNAKHLINLIDKGNAAGALTHPTDSFKSGDEFGKYNAHARAILENMVQNDSIVPPPPQVKSGGWFGTAFQAHLADMEAKDRSAYYKAMTAKPGADYMRIMGPEGAARYQTDISNIVKEFQSQNKGRMPTVSEMINKIRPNAEALGLLEHVPGATEHFLKGR